MPRRCPQKRSVPAGGRPARLPQPIRMFVPLSQIGFNPNRAIPTEDDLQRLPTVAEWLRKTVSPLPDDASIDNAVRLAHEMAARRNWMALDQEVMAQRRLTADQYWIWILGEDNEEELARDLLAAGACVAQSAETADRTTAIHSFYNLFEQKYGDGPTSELFAEHEGSPRPAAQAAGPSVREAVRAERHLSP